MKKMTKVNKKELQGKVIELLSKKLGEKKNNPMHFTAQVDSKEVVKAVKEQGAETSKLIISLAKEVVKLTEGVEILNFPKKVDVEMAQPKWYKAPEKAPDTVSIKGPVEVKQDLTGVAGIASAFLSALTDFFTKLSNKVFHVTVHPDHYTTPQSMVILDPFTMKAVDLKELFSAKVMIGGGGMIGGSANTNETIADQLDQYRISDGDEAGTTKYYGYVDKYGNWYIMQNDTTANTFRYFRGSGDYATNWADRATFTYDYFNVIF